MFGFGEDQDHSTAWDQNFQDIAYKPYNSFSKFSFLNENPESHLITEPEKLKSSKEEEWQKKFVTPLPPTHTKPIKFGFLQILFSK